MRLFSPALSGEYEPGVWDFKKRGPTLALPKLNGIRGCNQGGELYARSLKAIANKHTREMFSQKETANVEGELVVGNFADEDVFCVSTSGIRSTTGEPDVRWYAFDYYHPTANFIDRITMRDGAVAASGNDNIILVPYRWMYGDEDVHAYMQEAIIEGYEGLVLRDPKAKYKEGRATDAEGSFLRVVPWYKSEAIILSIVERRENKNEAVKNELGYMKRSAHKANMVGLGRAGSWWVRDMRTGLEFSMAIPTDKLQAEVWANPENFIGQPAHYKFKTPVKKGGLPRFGQYLGLRAQEDMS